MLLLKYLLLFPPWLAANWQARDDTGGGGTSKSTLSITPAGTANFSGTVSYTAIMNGGGFASVRTSPPKLWNWSDYECGGLKLDVKVPQGSKKKFQLLLWNSIPPPKTPPDQAHWFSIEFLPEQWKRYDTVRLPFDKFKAYSLYGKEILVDPPRLDLGMVKAMSFLISGRAEDAVQEGVFWLEIKRVQVEGGGKKSGKCWPHWKF